METCPVVHRPKLNQFPTPNQGAAAPSPVRIAYISRSHCHVVLRRFDAACDSFDELTEMLHRSFARLGSMELNCACVDQSAEVTRERALRGTCYIAVCNARIVGTMTLYTADRYSFCEHYCRDDVASIRQFGVDPAYQRRGIGEVMLAFADHWAATRGYAQLALDTPQPAAHLTAFYRGQGFRIAEFVRLPGKLYDSAILSKPPVAYRALATWSSRLQLHHADARAA